MERAALHQAFFGRFAERSAPVRVSEEELTHAETELGVLFPDSYRTFVLRFGAFHMPGLLRVIVDHEVALHALQEFFAAKDIVEVTTMYRTGGMRDDLVGIASDCMGNLVCFSMTDLKARRDDAPIYFFDHDFAEDSSEEMRSTEGFDDFLAQYVEKIPKT
jgi:hypothetical protein